MTTRVRDVALTDRERALVALLRTDPMLAPAEMARRLGTTREAVNVHLSRLARKGVLRGRAYVLAEDLVERVVVLGGANLDVVARTAAPVVAATSNPGRTLTSLGGVARNVAENLARLGRSVHLVSAVGQDPAGERLLAETAAAGVLTGAVVRSAHPTGSYAAVLDHDGELVVAVADMDAVAGLRPEDLPRLGDLVAGARLLVMDANLSPATAAYALELAAAREVPALVEPVSVAKAAALGAVLDGTRPVHTLTPNRDELAALTGRPVGDDAEVAAAVRDLVARGVQRVWVRLGAEGSLLFDADSAADEAAVRCPAQPADVVDVTGAGDAMLAGYAHALLAGAPPVDAVRVGQAAAALTVQVRRSVRADLTPALLQRALDSARPDHPTTGAPR